MKGIWLKIAARYDALQLRERWMIAAALLGGIVMIGYSLCIEPALKRAQQAERSAQEQGAQISGLRAQMQALQSPERNPDVAARAELELLKNQLNAISERLKVMESSLVPPQRMPALLEEMVGRKNGLRLISLKTLPVAPLLDKKSGAEEKNAAKPVENLANASDKPEIPSAGLFKHGVEIKLEGSYQELFAYLERLEQAKFKLLWSSASLSAEKHPKLVLTLTVFTISLDRAWLII